MSVLFIQQNFPGQFKQLARAFARAHYDLKRVCLPGQVQWAILPGG